MFAPYTFAIALSYGATFGGCVLLAVVTIVHSRRLQRQLEVYQNPPQPSP